MFNPLLLFEPFHYRSLKEERIRRAELIIEKMNQPLSERVMQLPPYCKCGYKGKSSDEMETHFKECNMYAEKVIGIIRQENNKF